MIKTHTLAGDGHSVMKEAFKTMKEVVYIRKSPSPMEVFRLS